MQMPAKIQLKPVKMVEIGPESAVPDFKADVLSAARYSDGVVYWTWTPHSGCALMVSMSQSVDSYTSAAFWYW